MYVSYNVYPGWHLRGVVREMMQYHVADFPTPKQKIAQARGLLDFLVKHARARSQAYSTLLKDEAEMLSQSLDSYLFHEHLEEVNEPLYFHQFVRRVDNAGLRYLADAAISTMLAQMFDESAAEILRGAPLLRREQYMDFLRSRMFRSSLICRPELQPDYRLDSNHLLDMHISIRRQLNIVSRADNKVEWQNSDGKITTEEPVTSVMDQLNRSFPAWTKVSDLMQPYTNPGHRKMVLDALLMSFVQNIVHLAFEPVEACTVINEKPVCTPLARYQAARGDRVTSLIHHDFIVQPQQRFMIHHLDGTRTAQDLARMLGDEVKNKRFKVSKEGKDVLPNEQETMRICEEELNRLRCLHLLVG
jgi:methyltransferase-like protein